MGRSNWFWGVRSWTGGGCGCRRVSLGSGCNCSSELAQGQFARKGAKGSRAGRARAAPGPGPGHRAEPGPGQGRPGQACIPRSLVAPEGESRFFAPCPEDRSGMASLNVLFPDCVADIDEVLKVIGRRTEPSEADAEDDLPNPAGMTLALALPQLFDNFPTI